MSLFVIKMIALITMAIDHLGVFFFPEEIIFRLVGRLSFPLFAWAIANGSIYTKNIYKYLFRIFVLAVISQIPYFLLFKEYGVNDPGLNILFTLVLGLMGITIIQKTGKLFIHIIVVFLLSYAAVLINSDYGAFGVLTVIMFYAFFKNRFKALFFYMVLTFTFYIFPMFANKLIGEIYEISYLNILQIFSLLSLLVITAYNGKAGKKLKYFFYAFYPTHLLIIYFIKLYFIK